MEKAYKMFLAINATSWVVVIYGIKEDWTIVSFPSWMFALLLLITPVLLSAISICLTLPLGKDTLENCSDLEEVNNSFLPTYLGYFFVGLGIEKFQHLVFVYLIILVFTYMAQTQYFNPIFLLFGYRFYNVITSKRTKVFIISKQHFRNPKNAGFRNLRRINNTTFIDWEDKNEAANS